jgi:hypothetical protein
MENWHVDVTFTGDFCGDPLCSCAERAHERGIISRRTMMERMSFDVQTDPLNILLGIQEAERFANHPN